MRRYVVFDNNAYKRINPDRLARIMTAERDAGFVPLASHAVLQELLARAQDDDRAELERNRAAIRKLGVHCRSDREGRVVINFLSDTDRQVYRLLTGKPHPADEDMLARIGQIVQTISAASTNDPLVSLTNELIQIRAWVARGEAAYVERLRYEASRKPEPDRRRRNFDYAKYIALRAQVAFHVQFPPEEIVAKIVPIAKLTSIGFELHDAVVADVRAKGGGHGRHKNTLWDEEIVSSTSLYTEIDGSNVVLVTTEQKLLDAAARADCADRVCDTESYEEMLGL